MKTYIAAIVISLTAIVGMSLTLAFAGPQSDAVLALIALLSAVLGTVIAGGLIGIYFECQMKRDKEG